jgi:hypothetical protein
LYLTLGYQTAELLVNMGLIATVYIQCTTLGFRTQVLPNVPLQVQKALYSSFIIFVSCAFHVNPLSRKSPKYLTFEVSYNVSTGSWFLQAP